MDGQQKLFTALYIGKAKKRVLQTISTENRDIALAHRYYYYIEIKRMRYDDALIELEKDFFISQSVIVKRLGVKFDLIKTLLGQNPKSTKLKAKYPNFNWR